MLLGFGFLEGDYIDLLYVKPEFAGMGVAFGIYRNLESEARRNAHQLLNTDASMVAQAFFERQGFRVISENKNFKEGEVLVNYRMEKQLAHLKGL